MSVLFYFAFVPALALVGQWLAWRTRLPSILLLLLLGMLLGQFISPDDMLVSDENAADGNAASRLIFPFVSLAVAVIMFEGGLSLKLSELREAGGAVLRLCTVGSLFTLFGTAIIAQLCFDLGWKVSFLLGSILVVTGPTVIGPLLRQVRPSSRVSNTLKWEGIVSDPIGAVLAVLVFDVLILHHDAGFVDGALLLAWTALVGTVVGVAGGFAVSKLLKRFLIPDHLHGFAGLASAVLMFAGCDLLAHESGLIAVTIVGIWLSNQEDLEIEHIIEFKENLRTILIGCLFIILASRVDLAALSKIAGPGLLFVAGLVLVVRPLSVFVALAASELNLREQSFVAALAPRGIVAAAVSSVFALRMEQVGDVGSPNADQLGNVAFLAIIGTVTVYGLLASPIARFLGLSDPNRNGVLILGADDWVVQFAKELQRAGIRVLLVDNNYRKVTQAKLEEIEAVCANVMNEHAQEDLPLGGIGHFLAMTPNDHVNSLAVRECRSLFGRSKTFQLTFKTGSVRGLTKNMMGRELFSEDLTHTHIAHQVDSGMQFKTTKLSEEFDREDFEALYPEHQTLAVINDGKLRFVTTDEKVSAASSDSIIALVPATEDSALRPTD